MAKSQRSKILSTKWQNRKGTNFFSTKKRAAFPLFSKQKICKLSVTKKFPRKIDRISALFSKNLTQGPPVLEAAIRGWWCVIFPGPAPTPAPFPSKAPTFGHSQCQGWERVGGKGDRELVTSLKPPANGTIFSGCAKGRRVEGGLRSLDLPRPAPRLPTQVPCSLLARHGQPEWEGGGWGRYEVPTPTLQ